MKHLLWGELSAQKRQRRNRTRRGCGIWKAGKGLKTCILLEGITAVHFHRQSLTKHHEGNAMKSLLTMILTVTAFIGGCVFNGFITRVPQDALTSGRLMRLKKDIEKCYAVKRTVPKTLSEVTISASNQDATNNAWGGVIHYSVSNETTVVLKTYGPGGPHAEVRQEFSLQFDLNGRDCLK